MYNIDFVVSIQIFPSINSIYEKSSFITTACFTCHPEAFAQANDKQNVIFIFDASGSMWGKLEKSTKIQVAKKTMGELFGKLDPQTKVGLIVYGHRSKDYWRISKLFPF
ncbi:MAG: VWA domain-containing protein [Saprospiraceae bacterium]|nr:VWA domain-containing protein [Saprospiraceae bacterium]